MRVSTIGTEGPLMECLDHLICAFDEQYIDQAAFNNFEVHYAKILRMLNGYIAYLKSVKKKIDYYLITRLP